MTFAFASITVEPKQRLSKTALRVRDLPADMLHEAAIMYGRNSEGKIRVYARNDCSDVYVQVGLYDRWELANEHCKQMIEDRQFRSREIRDAKKREPFQP